MSEVRPDRSRVLGAGLGVLALLIGACAATAVPTPSGPAASAASALASVEVTVEPTATPEATPSPSPSPAPLRGLALEVVAEGLSHPLDVRARPGDGALFVSEQVGVIRRVVAGAAEHPVMLDIGDVVNSFSIEQGLLGFAFHPDYPDDPRVFAYHSLANNDNVLVSYEHAGDPDVLDPTTRRELLVVDKEPDRVRHNGGTVLFGPDGMLYLSIGDAELGRANSQTPTTFPGSVLRVDVDRGDPYAIPPDNPFADGGTVAGVAGAPEVWWFGLRNPWRITFDDESGLAYVADVGQERAEEVSVVPLTDGGLNFGWPAREGLSDFLSHPLATEPIDPVIEVVHDDVERGCSITGGPVYRGAAIPELDGHYLYADWCYGWVRSFLLADGSVTEPQDWSADLDAGTISAFGVDADGEILVLGWDTGTIYRIVPVR